MKNIPVIVFVLFFFISNMNVTFANEAYSISNASKGESSLSFRDFSCGEKLISDELQDDIETYKKEEANMAEKFLTTQVQNIIRVGDLNGLSTLIFGNPYCVWGGNLSNSYDATMASNGIFTANEQEKIINPLLKLFGSTLALLITLSFLISGLKLMINGWKGRAFSEFGENVGMYVLVILLALGYSMVLEIIFQMNAAVVSAIKSLITSQGVGLNRLSLLYDFKAIHLAIGMGPFLLLMLAEWILALILNFVYMARKVVIVLLIPLGLVAIYSLLFSKTRPFFGTWLREFIGNVFLQAIHALVLYTMIMFAEAGSSTIFKLGLLIMFIPVSGMISKWLNIGDTSTKLGSAMTMAGFGGLVSTAMLMSQAKTVMSGGSLIGNSKFSSQNGGDAINSSNSSVLSSLASDTGITSISAKSSGVNSPVWNSTKDTVGKMGMGIGAIAGLVAGPAGAVLGAKGGKFVAENAVQMARNLPAGLVNVAASVQKGKAFASENGEGFRGMFSKSADINALMARRETMGNIGESLGGLLGLRAASIGRSFGTGLSGVSRERLANMQAVGLGLVDPKTGVPSALSFAQLATRFPNADAKWVQSNEGSAMFVNTPDGWQQVGLRGAADINLRDGEFRAIDYKLADPSLNYELQQNGTYKAPINDTNTLESLNSGNIPDFKQALSMDSYLSSQSNVGSTSFNEALNSNPSLSTMSVHDLAIENGGFKNMSVASIVSQNETLGNMSASDFFKSNPDIASGLRVNSNDSGLTNMTMKDFIDTSSADGSFASPVYSSLSEIMMNSSGAHIVSASDFATANPVVGGLTLSDITQGNSSQSFESFVESNPHLSAAFIPDASEPPTIIGTSNHKMETVGLSGSSESLFRTSAAYIAGGSEYGSSHINAGVIQHISDKATPTYQDSNFRADSVNPDQLLYHNPKGVVKSTGSDHLAKSIEKTNQVRNQWMQKLQEQRQGKSTRKII